MMDEHRKVILVIGNGFDMDLGWKTSYKSFAISDFWPFKDDKKDLGGYLETHSKSDKWFDLEALLRSYSAKEKPYLDTSWRYRRALAVDENLFESLRKQLINYLRTQENRDVNKDSVAAYLLGYLCEHPDILKIYSFNYTSLDSILSKLSITKTVNCEHIHGELKNNSIILGIDENVECFDGYHIFIKPVQPTYTSHPILEDLYFADEVIFFGMSFGDIDYPYFQMFFKDRCDEDKYYGEFSKKRIAIFTYDIASGRDIKFQLMKMNNKKLMQMYNFNTLKFFYTKDGVNRDIVDYLNEIK